MTTFTIFSIFFIFIVISSFIINKNDNTYSKIFNQEKMNDVFSNIYKNKAWGSGSGLGSYIECTGEYLKFLNNFIYSHDIHTIVDLGCGDWQMLKHFNFANNITYYGYDVVTNIIEIDKKLYEKSNIKFFYLENISTMNKADLLIIKDVLIHWKNDIIIYFLKNIMIKYKYTILVNDFKYGMMNIDINIGQFRALNLEIEPFNYAQFDKHIDMLFCKTLKRIYINSN